MIINFSNIGSGSGGGSGYTLPIATETRLGGVKVGSGLAIDPSTGVLSASGGSSESNYLIVDALSAVTNPYEGLKVYDKSARTEYFYDGTKFDIISELTFNLDDMSQQERADLNAFLFALPATVRKETRVYRDNVLCRYQRDEGSGTGRKIWYQELNAEESDNPTIHIKRFALKPDGSYENAQDGKYAAMALFEVDYSAHTLSSVNAGFYSTINQARGEGGRVALNMRLKIERGTKYVYSTVAWVEPFTQFTGIIGGEWLYNGNVIKATWNINTNTATLASWTEMPEITAIGNGLTVSGGTLSVSGGGSSEQNYQIVDDLSEVQNPQAGTKVYVRSGSTTENYSGFTFDGTQISEGYVGTVQRNGNTIWSIYRSGTDFYWGWNNDGNMHSAEQDGETCFYMCDTQNGIFYIFISDLDGVTAVPAENATTGSTSTGITISWEAQSLIYTGAEYVTTSDVIYDLDSMTQSERASLVNYLLASTDIERIGAHIYKDHMKCRFDHIEDGKINFNCHYIDTGNAFPQIKTENFFIKSDGSYESDDIQDFGVTVNAWVNYNDTGHTLQTSNISFWGIGRSVTRNNLNIILTTGSSLGDAVVTAPAIVERTGDWTGNFYVTFIYDGKKIEASWSFDENTPTTTKWVETPL